MPGVSLPPAFGINSAWELPAVLPLPHGHLGRGKGEDGAGKRFLSVPSARGYTGAQGLGDPEGTVLPAQT